MDILMIKSKSWLISAWKPKVSGAADTVAISFSLHVGSQTTPDARPRWRIRISFSTRLLSRYRPNYYGYSLAADLSEVDRRSIRDDRCSASYLLMLIYESKVKAKGPVGERNVGILVLPSSTFLNVVEYSGLS
jgi:hypothetical protein